MGISQAKQISDKEKIEIMQHYLDGGEIECKSDEKDWQVVQPSWAWNNCFYRKRVYNYPLYFEFNNVHNTESEKFIVEFTGLTEGTVVQKTYSEWEIGHFDNVWFSHTEKNFWREVDKPNKISDDSRKLEYLKETQHKFETNDYICVWQYENHIQKISNPIWGFTGEYKLIHKRHQDVLEAYLENNDIDIEYFSTCNDWITIDSDFLQSYDVDEDYRIKEPESQIVYECYRTNKKTRESEICTKLLTDKMLKILEDENRTLYTYNKTGRSFEIKLGDK